MLICGEIASTLGESLAVFRALATFVRALIPCVDTECHRVPQPSAAVPGYAHRRTRTGSCVLSAPEAQGSLTLGPRHGTTPYKCQPRASPIDLLRVLHTSSYVY